MAIILDEGGSYLLDEALAPLYDEEGTFVTAPTAMAATHLSQTPVSTPTPAAVDAVNGNITPNSGRTVFRIKSTDGAATHTVTFQSVVTADNAALQMPGLVVTIPISGDVQVSDFDPVTFGAQMTWLASDATHLTVSAIEPG